MTLLISKLDKRLLKASQRSGKNFTRLRREDGEPIICAPPLGVPKWAIDSNFCQSYGTSDAGSSSVGLSTVDSVSEDSDFSVE